ncbi:MAG: hypothetical protein CVU71_14420 [Deltaproteobacteria bacterium HGW-Deltaproteobacteria-6]|jgi:hypothetical protein|nr:MAG: hypothetical protein CVU71_14420 [Deltaproteobacteria bacterium HGW-Deltaproteobacteria-6]
MKKQLLIVLVALILSSLDCFAEDVPKIIEDGLAAYKTSGTDMAVTTWLKGSPLENEKTVVANMKGGIVQIESMCGKMKLVMRY